MSSINNMRSIDWDKVEKQVVVKLRLLKATVMHLEPNRTNDMIVRDLIYPAFLHLIAFVDCVQIQGDEGEETDGDE